MAGVAEEAIGKIRRLTDEAREVARWYEKNPTQLYLPEGMEHFRTREWLSMNDLSEILYAVPMERHASPRWCDANGVTKRIREKRACVRFADVEAAVLRLLPRGFPVADSTTGLKYSDALFVIQRNALATRGGRFRCVIELVTNADIGSRLGQLSTSGIKSIFDRFGFYEEDGSSIHVTTHQFRHYLNTLAQAGGMSQLDIAKWSGRKDVRQNRHYDHETSDAVVARIRPQSVTKRASSGHWPRDHVRCSSRGTNLPA